MWRWLRVLPGLPPLVAKALRDLLASAGQFLACWFIVVLGTASYVALASSSADLWASISTSYRTLKFADFSVRMQSAPSLIVDQLRQLPGVDEVYGRVSAEVELRQPNGTNRKIIGRVIGVPVRGRPPVNDLAVVEGAWIDGPHQVLLVESFARYHGYRPGSTLWTEDAGGHRERCVVAGLVRSPEYIWMIRDKEYLMPSPSTFGVLYMAEDEAARVTGLSGRINEIQVTMRDASKLALAMAEAHQLLNAYGAEDPVARADQPSNQLVTQDVQGFETLAVYFPALFLGLAALTIVSLLNRIILSQRPQIGILMALGCRPEDVASHYMTFGWVLGVLGGAAGAWLGHVLGHRSTLLFTSVLGVPYTLMTIHWNVVGRGMAVGLAVPLVSAWYATRSVLRIEPAAAMYAEVATVGRKPWIEYWIPPLAHLKLRFKLPLRNLFRQPRRTLMTAFGIAIAISQVITTTSLQDSRSAAIDKFLYHIIGYDMRVLFLLPRSESVVDEIRLWPGVEAAEPSLELPVELYRDGKKYNTLLFGIEPASQLVHLYDRNDLPAVPTDRGLLFGSAVERHVGLHPGYSVELRVPHRDPKEHQQRFFFVGAEEMHQPIGSIVYLPIDTVRQKLAAAENLPPRAVNSVLLRVRPEAASGVQDHLYRLPGAAAVEKIDLLRKEIQDLLKSFNAYMITMVLFSAGLGFAIIFNSVTLAILERTREIATMRTLGFGNTAIAAMIVVENLIVWAVGAVVGVPLGYWLSAFFVMLYQTDFAAFTLAISPTTVTWVVAGSFLVTLVAEVPAIRYAVSLDLSSTTRERTS